MDRRLFLSRAPLAAAAAALPAVAVASSLPATQDDLGPVKAVIERHHRAWEKFEALCPCADESDERYSEEGARQCECASDDEEDALDALVAFVPRNMGEVRLRSAYLFDCVHRGRIQIIDERFEALLGSMA